MTTPGFLTLVALVPALLLAGSPKLLGQIEQAVGGAAGPAKPAAAPPDWRKNEAAAGKWRGEKAVTPHGSRVQWGEAQEDAELPGEPAELVVLRGTEQDQDTAAIEGMEPITTSRDAYPYDRTSTGNSRLRTELSAPDSDQPKADTVPGTGVVATAAAGNAAIAATGSSTAAAAAGGTAAAGAATKAAAAATP